MEMVEEVVVCTFSFTLSQHRPTSRPLQLRSAADGDKKSAPDKESRQAEEDEDAAPLELADGQMKETIDFIDFEVKNYLDRKKNVREFQQGLMKRGERLRELRATRQDLSDKLEGVEHEIAEIEESLLNAQADVGAVDRRVPSQRECRREQWILFSYTTLILRQPPLLTDRRFAPRTDGRLRGRDGRFFADLSMIEKV